MCAIFCLLILKTIPLKLLLNFLNIFICKCYLFILLSDGTTIPKGTTTIITAAAMHMREDIFPDPEKFDPERFLPENSHRRHPYAYIPFSAGSRNCIGK